MTIAPTTQSMATAAHLNDEQVDDQLIGDLSGAAAVHLAGCELCTARVAEAAAPMESFRTVSLAWGERVSAATPIPRVAQGRPEWERRLAWSLGVAACAVGLGIAGAAHRTTVTPMPEAAVTERAVSPTADQLSNDNQMLSAIDRELNATNETPAALGLVPVATRRTAGTQAHFVQTAVQD